MTERSEQPWYVPLEQAMDWAEVGGDDPSRSPALTEYEFYDSREKFHRDWSPRTREYANFRCSTTLGRLPPNIESVVTDHMWMGEGYYWKRWPQRDWSDMFHAATSRSRE